MERKRPGSPAIQLRLPEATRAEFINACKALGYRTYGEVLYDAVRRVIKRARAERKET